MLASTELQGMQYEAILQLRILFYLFSHHGDLILNIKLIRSSDLKLHHVMFYIKKLNKNKKVIEESF